VQDNSDQPYTALDILTQSKESDANIPVFMMGSNDTKPENWHGAEAFKASLLCLLSVELCRCQYRICRFSLAAAIDACLLPYFIH